MIYTYSDLRVEKLLKGDLLESEIRIVAQGGVVDGEGVSVEDQPIFHRGERVRLYLQENNGELIIVCDGAGVRSLVERPQPVNSPVEEAGDGEL